MIDDDAVVRRKSDLISVEGGGEAVVLDAAQGDFLLLNSTGTRIWALLDTPRTFAALCTALEERFEVDRATCRGEVLAFIHALDGRDLIEVVTSGGSSAD